VSKRRRLKNKESKRGRQLPVDLESLGLVDVVADGALASQDAALGKLIPLFIVDERRRPDITSLILAHQHLPPGDVRSIWWVTPIPSTTVVLTLKFDRPVVTILSIRLPVSKYGGMVDMIAKTGLLLIQGGQPGDRAWATHDAPKVLVEVGHDSFSAWEDVFLSGTIEMLRARGYTDDLARQLAPVLIARLREMQSFQFPS
jgi:hypothetical protein